MRTHRTTRALGGAALGLTLALTAAACGDDAEPTRSGAISATEHNEADVAFAGDMVQHHAQALAMVDLTAGRPLDPEVERLAEQIRDAQAPEIETFSGWLEEWGEKVPSTMRDHVNGGHGDDHEDMGDSMQGMDADMPGMMSADEMTGLEDASDAAFQAMWLRMMTAHHEGAVTMSRAELEQGRYEPALDLAKQIIASQTKEIATMKRLTAS